MYQNNGRFLLKAHKKQCFLLNYTIDFPIIAPVLCSISDVIWFTFLSASDKQGECDLKRVSPNIAPPLPPILFSLQVSLIDHVCKIALLNCFIQNKVSLSLIYSSICKCLASVISELYFSGILSCWRCQETCCPPVMARIQSQSENTLTLYSKQSS